MKNHQKVYDCHSITNDLLKHKSDVYHRKNLVGILKRKATDLYQINEDYVNRKKRSNSKKKNNTNKKCNMNILC